MCGPDCKQIQQLLRHFSQNLKHQPADDAKGKVRRLPDSVESIPWGPLTSVHNIMEIPPVDGDMFQSGPKRWTDRQTLPQGHAFRLAKNQDNIKCAHTDE